MRESKYALQLKTGLDLAALVDVVFLLLAYFLINTTLVQTAVINVELPGSTSTIINKKTSIVIEINIDNFLQINGQNIKLDALPQKIAEFHKKKPKAIYTIRAHKKSNYQSLVTVLDVLKNEGVKNINLDTARK